MAGLQSQGQNLEQFSQLVGTPAVVLFITEADLSASSSDIFLLLCQQRAELLFQEYLHIQGTLPPAVFWYLCSVSAVSKEGWAALRSTGLGHRKPVPDPLRDVPPHGLHSPLIPSQAVLCMTMPGLHLGQLQGGGPLEAQELTLGAYSSPCYDGY